MHASHVLPHSHARRLQWHASWRIELAPFLKHAQLNMATTTPVLVHIYSIVKACAKKEESWKPHSPARKRKNLYLQAKLPSNCTAGTCLCMPADIAITHTFSKLAPYKCIYCSPGHLHIGSSHESQTNCDPLMPVQAVLSGFRSQLHGDKKPMTM